MRKYGIIAIIITIIITIKAAIESFEMLDVTESPVILLSAQYNGSLPLYQLEVFFIQAR